MNRRTLDHIWTGLGLGLILLAATPALAAECVPTAPVSTVTLPGRAYAVIAAANGCDFYVSLATQTPDKPGAISLVQFSNGVFAVTHTVALTIQPQGLALSPDGAFVVAPGLEGVAFVNTARLAAGDSDAASVLADGGTGPIAASVTQDNRLVFVNDEKSNSVTVVDLTKARANGFSPASILGKVPMDQQPVGQALSPDGKYLYVGVEIELARPGLATPCKDAARGGAPGAAAPGAAAPAPSVPYPEGVVAVIDVARAARDSAHAVIAKAPSGCRPVRVVVSPDGSRIYLAARASNQIVAFDAAKLRAGASDARIGALTLPGAAIGLGRSNDGKTLYAGTPQNAVRIDAATLALAGTLPGGASARAIVVTPAGLALATTGKGLEVMDLGRAP